MLVDSNEPKEIRDYLVAQGHTAKRLPYADYWLCMTKDTPQHVVQRKRIQDLVASVYDDRLREDLARCFKAVGAAVLLVEGRYWAGRDGMVHIGRHRTHMPYLTLISGLTELALLYGVTVIHSPDDAPLTTERFLDKLERDLSSEHATSLLTRGSVRKRKTLPAGLSPSATALVRLNIGIGAKQALEILEHCSFQSLMSMDEAALRLLPHIGSLKAKRIREIASNG